MRSGLLHQWIQSGGILIAALWGFYVFIWQHILVPSWAPAHINLNVTLTPVEGRRESLGGVEMVLKVTATNPSRRKVYLLSNYWYLVGVKRGLTATQKPYDSEQQAFTKRANEALWGAPHVQSQRGVEMFPDRTLAVGRLFDDDIINPSETINRTILVSIPTDYSAAGVSVLVPGLSKPPDRLLFEGKQLRWSFSADDDSPIPRLCSQAAVGAADPSGEPFKGCEIVDRNRVAEDLKRFDPLMGVFSFNEDLALPLEAPKAHSAGQRAPRQAARSASVPSGCCGSPAATGPIAVASVGWTTCLPLGRACGRCGGWLGFSAAPLMTKSDHGSWG